MLALVGPGTPLWVLLAAYAVFGVGFGLGQPADHQHGGERDAALAGRGRGRGRLDEPAGRVDLGVAISGTVVAAAVGVQAGLTPAWWVVAVATAVVGILGVAATTARARATADRVADMFAEEPVPHRV